MSATKENFIANLVNLKDKPIPECLNVLEKHYKDKLVDAEKLWSFLHARFIIMTLRQLEIPGIEELNKATQSLIAIGEQENTKYRGIINKFLHALMEDHSRIDDVEYNVLMRDIDDKLSEHLRIGFNSNVELFHKLSALNPKPNK